jgi:hypothetical protein
VAAAGGADVVARNLDPLVIRRGGEHPREQLSVLGLLDVLLAQCAPGILDPVGKRVPNLLQLTEADQPRLAGDGRDPALDLDSRECP